MRICNERAEALAFQDLKAGDVFRWKASPEGVLIMKTTQGFVNLVTGFTVSTGPSALDAITHYPNACINPGEPE